MNSNKSNETREMLMFSFGAELLSKKQYYIRIGMLWAYGIVWAAILIMYISLFNELHITLKIIGGIIIFVFVPTPFHHVFRSYERYRSNWHSMNKQNT